MPREAGSGKSLSVAAELGPENYLDFRKENRKEKAFCAEVIVCPQHIGMRTQCMPREQ